SGRVHRGVAAVGAVRRAAPPAERASLRILLGVRKLPGRVHGREVLHRAAARRPGPRVCQRPWRAGADGGRARPGPTAVARPFTPDGPVPGGRTPAGPAHAVDPP